MNKTIEIAALALGGSSLFAVAFLGFAVMSGTPLHEVRGIGGLFDPPEESTRVRPSTARIETAPARRSREEVLQSGIGAMGAWSLPSPYSQAELGLLVDELKGKLHTLEAREAALETREREADERFQVLAERFAGMERLRSRLEDYERELELRELEVLRSEKATADRRAAKWQDVADILGTLDPRVAASRVVEYPPEEAARILRAMTTDEASDVLNQIGPESWKEYVEAYTELQTQAPARPAGS